MGCGREERRLFVSNTFLPRLNRTDVKFLYGGEYGDEKVD